MLIVAESSKRNIFEMKMNCHLIWVDKYKILLSLLHSSVYAHQLQGEQEGIHQKIRTFPTLNSKKPDRQNRKLTQIHVTEEAACGYFSEAYSVATHGRIGFIWDKYVSAAFIKQTSGKIFTDKQKCKSFSKWLNRNHLALYLTGH